MTLNYIPDGSDDLYENETLFRHIYGDDFFFVAGTVSGEKPGASKEFGLTGDCVFYLSEKVACNPDTREDGLTSEQIAARRAFWEYRNGNAENIDLFPTNKDIREQKRGGKGLCFLSGGAELFVLVEIDGTPEYRMALFERTDGNNNGQLTGPNGLASGTGTAAKEGLEELTLVDIRDADKPVVHCMIFSESGTPSAETRHYAVSFKKHQEPILKANLAKIGVAGDLEYDRAMIEHISPSNIGLPENAITILSRDGHMLDLLFGCVGFENDFNTLAYRIFGLYRRDADARLVVIDGEPYNRPGQLYSYDEIRDRLENGKILSSLRGMLEKIIDYWPTSLEIPFRPRPAWANPAEPRLLSLEA